jgi:hypothetical protein
LIVPLNGWPSFEGERPAITNILIGHDAPCRA